MPRRIQSVNDPFLRFSLLSLKEQVWLDQHWPLNKHRVLSKTLEFTEQDHALLKSICKKLGTRSHVIPNRALSGLQQFTMFYTKEESHNHG